MELLPSPDKIAEDLGELEPEPETSSFPPSDEAPEDFDLAPPSGPDEPPGHARRRKTRSDKGRTRTPPAKPARVTASIHKDIAAKVGFALTIPGTIWQARDPLCGGTFVSTIPEQAEIYAEWICESPDLLAFFTGPGGAFMRLLRLGAVLMPVGQVVMAHHVYHTIEDMPEDAQQPAQYAA